MDKSDEIQTQKGAPEDKSKAQTESQEIEKIPQPQSQDNNLPASTMYEATMEKDSIDGLITSHAQFYKLSVKNNNTGDRWILTRNYDDFAWFYSALKAIYPGYILPYFCSSSVLEHLNKKLTYLNPRQRNIFLVSRLQELRLFLDQTVKHPLFGFTDELRIFFFQNRDDLLTAKRKKEIWVQQLQSETSAKRVLSLLQKGISWFSSKNTEEPVLQSKEWSEIRYDVDLYSNQLYDLTQKLFLFKHSKEDEMAWKGPNTEIDQFERIRAKILSGNPSNQKLVSELQSKVLLPLMQECKKEGQLRRLMQEKEVLLQNLSYLKKTPGREGKLSQLQKRNEKFEARFEEEWRQFKSSWLQLMEELDGRFRSIIDNHQRQMSQLWM